MITVFIRVSTFFLSLLLLFGCAAQPIHTDPVFKHPLFNRIGVDRIMLLPIIDIQVDKTLETDYDDNVRDPLIAALRKKHYEIEIATKADISLSFADLQTKIRDPSWIRRLGQEHGRWVLLVTVDKLYRTITIQAKGYAEVSGYLFDTYDEELIWENKGTGEFAMGLFLTAFVDDDALRMATNNLALGFPIKQLQ